MNRTYTAKPNEVERNWHVVDAANVPVGRLASRVAMVLRGKHKPTFTYSVDGGDFVVVINADKAVWTGTKGKELLYHHSGFPGGLKSISREDLLEKNPAGAIERCVWGMLPKNKIGRHMLRRLKVYSGPEHKHEAQNPQPLKVTKS